MAIPETNPLVWVKDNAGNRFLCPLNALHDPNTVSEDQKKNCVDDASRLLDPKSVPGEGKIKFDTPEAQDSFTGSVQAITL